ncbi:glycoside hydrolase family 6 protein [Actinomycetes bacterium KLBMP 9797]
MAVPRTVLSGFVIGVLVAAGVPAVTSAALVPARGELVANGNFDTGVAAPWWSSANTPIAVAGGQLRATVPAGTTQTYDAMIGQGRIALTSGRAYTLVFDAAASAAVSVRVTVQLEAAPYTATLDQQVALGPTLKRYQLPFVSSLATTAGAVTVQVGGKGAFTATLDNVSLTPTPVALTNGFYSDPDSNAYRWLWQNPNDGAAGPIRTNIAERAGARWFGNWNADVTDGYLTQVRGYVSAADAAGKLPILAAYNIPGRDCGGPSQGGAGNEALYRAWIEQFVRAIGDRPAIVVIEPDAVNQSMVDACMTGAERQARWDLLRYATERFRDYAPNTWAYLDGGNYGWNQGITPAKIAQALDNSGVRNVRGFALNVSNYYTTAESNTAATQLNAALTSAYGYSTRYIVDTSRNGKGATGDGQWCNPPSRQLGVPSQVGSGGPELLLWVKVPGDSDGPCGIGPGIDAGTFDKCLAVHLINGTQPPADGICPD